MARNIMSRAMASEGPASMPLRRLVRDLAIGTDHFIPFVGDRLSMAPDNFRIDTPLDEDRRGRVDSEFRMVWLQ